MYGHTSAEFATLLLKLKVSVPGAKEMNYYVITCYYFNPDNVGTFNKTVCILQET